MRIRCRDTFSLPVVHLFADRDHHVEHIAQPGFDLVEPGWDVASLAGRHRLFALPLVKALIEGTRGSRQRVGAATQAGPVAHVVDDARKEDQRKIAGIVMYMSFRTFPNLRRPEAV